MDFPPTLGVVLAGGLARRMGGREKTLLEVNGRSLLDHVIARLTPQCVDLVISANGNPKRFGVNCPIIADTIPNNPGPLGGILAAMEWVSENSPDIEWIVTIPGDTPLVPGDLVRRLHDARGNSSIAVATSGNRKHHAVGLWSVHLKNSLHLAMTKDKTRAVGSWASSQDVAYAEWNIGAFDPFFNVNTPEDLAYLQAQDVLR